MSHGLPRLLLTGASGQVGRALLGQLPPGFEVIAPSRQELPLDQPGRVSQIVRSARPDLVLNAAAYTSVDQAEAEPALANAINAVAPGILGEECRRLAIPLLHLSTDYVFDGTGRMPRRETDPAVPLNVYGRTKLAGEQAILASGAMALIIRTSWVYSLHGRNFLLTMLRLARERDRITVVNDQVGTPTSAPALATALVALLHAVRRGTRFEVAPEAAGIFHLTGAGETTWYHFAREILALDPRRLEQRLREVVPIPTNEYPTPAKRPAYSVLDSSRMATAYGIRLPPWLDQLRTLFATHQTT